MTIPQLTVLLVLCLLGLGVLAVLVVVCWGVKKVFF